MGLWMHVQQPLNGAMGQKPDANSQKRSSGILPLTFTSLRLVQPVFGVARMWIVLALHTPLLSWAVRLPEDPAPQLCEPRAISPKLQKGD